METFVVLKPFWCTPDSTNEHQNDDEINAYND